MVVMFGIASHLENNTSPPPDSLKLFDLAYSFWLMKVLGFFAGITLIIVGLVMRSTDSKAG